jgi:putative aldouronate transport system substrate-binding protein
MMAAGNPPDICLTYSNELISNYRDLGGVFDVSPYIEQLLPDLKKFLGPDSALPGRDLIYRFREGDSGKVYSLPARRTNVAHRGTFIRGDWLDKLGLKLPTTTKEFRDALYAFKQRDPGGIGSALVVPFTMGSGVYFDAGNLIESFIDPNQSDKDWWINSVAGRNLLQPGYKEGVRFLNAMYNDGLIDRDFPLSNRGNEVDNLLKSGRVGAYQQNWDQVYRDSPGMLRDLQANVPGAVLVPCDPFVNAKGLTYKNAHDAVGIRFFVPMSAKYPQAAMRYVNWIARFENYNFLQVGPAGVTHDLVDGIPRIKPGTGLWIQNSPQNIDYTIHVNGLDLGDPAKTALGLAGSYTVDAQLIVDANAMSLKDARPMPVVADIVLVEANAYTQTLQDKASVIFAESITCAPAQFDRIWDAGIADWLASGGKVIRDERIAKYPQ